MLKWIGKKFKGLIKDLKNMSEEDVEATTYIFVGLIVAEVMIVHWYLKMERLSTLLLMFLVAGLVLVQMMAPTKPKKKPTLKG